MNITVTFLIISHNPSEVRDILSVSIEFCLYSLLVWLSYLLLYIYMKWQMPAEQTSQCLASVLLQAVVCRIDENYSNVSSLPDVLLKKVLWLGTCKQRFEYKGFYLEGKVNMQQSSGSMIYFDHSQRHLPLVYYFSLIRDRIWLKLAWNQESELV